VVNATLAISDFMLMLLTSALWLGSGVIGIVLLGPLHRRAPLVAVALASQLRF